MASVIERQGKRLLQWRMPTTNRRHYAGLGNTQAKAAQLLASRLNEVLAELKHAGAVSPASAAWLRSSGKSLRARFVECGLLEAELSVSALCEQFESRRKRKDATNVAYGHTIRNLQECYGANAPASSINAAKFRPYLEEQGLSPATCNRRVTIARSVFKDITPNPFAKVVGGGQRNSERTQYIPGDIVEHIAAHADVELAAALMLARFAGLRVPSELVGLRDTDIHWDKDRFWTRSPKTEHHEGGAGRFVPLFPKIQQTMLGLVERSTTGKLFPGLVDVSNVVLRRRMYRLLDRLNIKPWPRLFQNLRASWTTDTINQHGAARESKWGGHSPDIAMKHYHSVTDADFTAAAQYPAAHPSPVAAYGQQSSSNTTGGVSAGVQTVNAGGIDGRDRTRTTRPKSLKSSVVDARATINSKRQGLLVRSIRRSARRNGGGR
jgi:integrase